MPRKHTTPRKRAPKRPALMVHCTYCGMEFRTAPSRIDQGNGRYCSRSCSQDDRRRPLDERFWSRVERGDGCWNFPSSDHGKGYRRFSVGQQSHYAHRIAWALIDGAIPDDLGVLHHCDNRACVRPDHLFLGTNLDNIEDKVRKGRQQRGETSGRTKLTGEDVRTIRTKAIDGENNTAIARTYGVSRCCISAIVLRRNWRHIVRLTHR